MAFEKISRKKWWTGLSILIFIGVAIQFIRPAIGHPPVTGDLIAPAAVKEILRRACYDCHSNETNLAWFDQPEPAYWFVAKDVRKGRAVLNFSNWDSLQPPQQVGKLFESLSQIEFNVMPLPQYSWLHHGSRIDSNDLAVLKQYGLTMAASETPDTARQNAAREQYEKWVKSATAASVRGFEVKMAPNGISYENLSGFKYWKAISSSERFDNGTLRIIFGNDIAVKAIREGHTNPWPDGSTFAKAAWDQSADTSGLLHTGAFKQVEFMIRDREKYSATDGWGWARWVGGLALKPYGHDLTFTTECTSCHRPMSGNDHVFTFPVADTISLSDNPGARGGEDHYPLQGKVITSFVNKNERTMSTLYGNDMAAQNARAGRNYMPGSVLSLVTWSQKEDPHWYGARIASGLYSIEQIHFSESPGSLPAYQKYDGASLKKIVPSGQETETIRKRIAFITGWKASVVPRAN